VFTSRLTVYFRCIFSEFFVSSAFK
jgi:hypothetical protein